MQRLYKCAYARATYLPAYLPTYRIVFIKTQVPKLVFVMFYAHPSVQVSLFFRKIVLPQTILSPIFVSICLLASGYFCGCTHLRTRYPSIYPNICRLSTHPPFVYVSVDISARYIRIYTSKTCLHTNLQLHTHIMCLHVRYLSTILYLYLRAHPSIHLPTSLSHYLYHLYMHIMRLAQGKVAHV